MHQRSRSHGLGLAAAILAVAATACSSPAPETDPGGSLTPAASLVALPSASEISSAEPPPFGSDVFADPNDCRNSMEGYRVAYPGAWSTNEPVTDPNAGVQSPGCEYFAPVPFELACCHIGPPIAIYFRVFQLPAGTDWTYDLGADGSVLSDSPVTVSGYPARVREVEVTVPGAIPFDVGDRYTEYIVELPENRFLRASTVSTGDQYREARAVLGDMMETLEL